ncbi:MULTISPECIES: hypothetical protein [Nostoc]|uniref:Uncharacterized protein n=1 Tax=Nostoc paludosum FACHB-159 TaxID=2692908 RepID=A0ABR8KGI2_9NOSO|nr:MULTISPECIES: hypothetical protein [Nostoc]MBD2681527.1 hypothetical protein [Nostoc sp. FACHB-857]MBD2737988.1 hypothetical protein [Nostoc paludosum FACHB-159]
MSQKNAEMFLEEIFEKEDSTGFIENIELLNDIFIEAKKRDYEFSDDELLLAVEDKIETIQLFFPERDEELTSENLSTRFPAPRTPEVWLRASAPSSNKEISVESLEYGDIILTNIKNLKSTEIHLSKLGIIGGQKFTLPHLKFGCPYTVHASLFIGKYKGDNNHYVAEAIKTGITTTKFPYEGENKKNKYFVFRSKNKAKHTYGGNLNFPSLAKEIAQNLVCQRENDPKFGNYNLALSSDELLKLLTLEGRIQYLIDKLRTATDKKKKQEGSAISSLFLRAIIEKSDFIKYAQEIYKKPQNTFFCTDFVIICYALVAANDFLLREVSEQEWTKEYANDFILLRGDRTPPRQLEHYLRSNKKNWEFLGTLKK